MSVKTEAFHPGRVVVGMSGGVDSSVAALLLKQQGYEVVAMFMKNWEETNEQGICHAAQDYQDVRKVCDVLDIPYYSIEFVKEYRDIVFARFLDEYRRGLTPNPDILCNREIKFNAFYKKAVSLGAEFLATGHYSQITKNPTSQLARAIDLLKDQTYFLYTLTSEILDRVLFPIGHLQKSEVRELARKNGLPTHDKKDSTGICFIGERNFTQFLGQYLVQKKGEFRLLDQTPVGEHQGAVFYTLGQRRGLKLGGPGERWYVVAKDIEQNIVYVERGDDHPALYAGELWAGELSFVTHQAPSSKFRCTAKSRYRQEDQPCLVEIKQARAYVQFDEPQRALTPGQSIVFYDQEICLGGGVIEKVGPSQYEKRSK